MTTKAIFFDLDGTLTDSGEGIINCARRALDHFGLPQPTDAEMRVFVGPPLRETFAKFGVPENGIEKALEIYRERYNPIGIFENVPYPGIHNLLAKLRQDGHRLYLATAKPEVMARRIMDRFELAPYFELICGASLDHSRDSKAGVIAYLLEQIPGIEQVIMVGDTAYDVTGAAEHGIPTIGVSWGYGKVEDMTAAGAVAIANSMDDLYQLLNESCHRTLITSR